MDKYISKVKGIATPPPSYNSSCCGWPRRSVLMAGEIAGVTAKQLDMWLSTVTPVRFVHIIKRTEKSYGHIHFGSHTLASEFYNAMNQTTFKFGCRKVCFSAAKKFSGELIIYQNDSVEELPKAKSVPHALYREKGWFVIIIHAPGIKKDLVKVAVSGENNKIITVTGVVPPPPCQKKFIINTLPTGAFEFDVELPGKVDTTAIGQVSVQDGVVTIKVKEAPKQQYIKLSVVDDEDSEKKRVACNVEP
uniref:17. class II heat shock protein n=2 Tax=Anthurium amnicola TaxID=1678845 RepID=A0A1D1Z0J9_9ARAE